MSYKENILKKLREHALPPPPHLFEQIAAEAVSSHGEGNDDVQELSLLAGLKRHSAAIPEGLEQQVLAEIAEQQAAYSKKLSELHAHELQHPAGIFEKILEKIKRNGQAGQQGVVRFIKRYKAAAAVIVATTLAAAIYLSIGKDYQEQSTAENELAKVKEEEPVAPVVVPPADSTRKSLPPVTDHRALYSAMKKENFFFSNTLRINGWSYNMGNQEMLAAFASFRYADMPAAFWEKGVEETAWLQVDDYTAIGVSPAMRDMMKKMYEVKRNGKPTAKAKREKRKLKRWIKADKKRFDKTMSRNPLDPLDLADFIFD